MVVWNKSFAKWFSAEYMIERFFFFKNVWKQRQRQSLSMWPYVIIGGPRNTVQELLAKGINNFFMLLHGLQKAKTKTIIFKYLWPKMGCYKYVTNAFVLTQRELKTTVNGYRMNEISPKGNLLSLCFALSHWHARIKLFINRFGAPSLINALIYRWH